MEVRHDVVDDAAHADVSARALGTLTASARRAPFLRLQDELKTGVLDVARLGMTHVTKWIGDYRDLRYILLPNEVAQLRDTFVGCTITLDGEEVCAKVKVDWTAATDVAVALSTTEASRALAVSTATAPPAWNGSATDASSAAATDKDDDTVPPPPARRDSSASEEEDEWTDAMDVADALPTTATATAATATPRLEIGAREAAAMTLATEEAAAGAATNTDATVTTLAAPVAAGGATTPAALWAHAVDIHAEEVPLVTSCDGGDYLVLRKLGVGAYSVRHEGEASCSGSWNSGLLGQEDAEAHISWARVLELARADADWRVPDTRTDWEPLRAMWAWVRAHPEEPAVNG